MKAAKDASDLADSKRRVFYSSTTPTEPFDEGDLWLKQVNGKNETWVYNGKEWVKSNDKDLADFTDAVNKELAGIQAQLDGKAETWYQDTDPSTNWTTQDKANHEGDIWYNTTDGTTQYWNATTWEKMDIPKDVFDTIDGKSSIYVDSYADAKAGKGVISKGYDERDIWILPSDAVVNSIQYYKGDILTATANSSTFNEKHWVKKVRYVGEKELNSAVSVVQKQIDTINNTTLPNINKQFNDFVKDGILTTSEKARLKEALAALTSDKSKLLDSVAEVEKSEYLKNDTLVIPDLKTYVTALTNSFTKYESFVKTLIADSKTNITKTELATYQNNYTNLVNAINNVRYQITMCQSQIYKNIGADITTYKYLKEAIKGHTQINGGLVFTNVIQLRKTADVNSQVTAGISGLQAKTDANGNIIAGSEDLSSIASWYGGPMVDRVTIDGVPSTWNEDTIKTDMGKKYAASIFRHDGSGYFAGGRIWWDRETGELHVNANSFIVNKDDLGLLATLFRLNLGTKYNIISAQPTAPFTNLTVLGSKTLNGITIGTPTSGGRIVIGNIVISNSGASNVVEISNLDGTKIANLGVSGGVSAYGTYTPSTGGGGGLNASVVSYANIIASNYNDSDVTTVPNAYSIKALYNAIQNIDVSSQLGNYLLKSDAATIYQPKGNYLTSHQSLDGYINSIATSGSGNAITSVTKSGKTVTFTKGVTFLTSHQNLSAYLKSADAANTYLKLSGGDMTGNIRYKGPKNTYDMITFVDNNVDIYGNGICIGGGGLTIIGGGESASNVLKQHTNGGDEKMIVANDSAIDFFSNMSSGWDSRKAGSFDTSGYWNGVGFKKNNSNDNYVLTGGGGHKAISTLSVSYASSAGSANSVAWSNVSGRPTKVSQFTNDSNYATQSWVTGKGYLTSHQDISGKVNRTGDYLDTDSNRWWLSNSIFGINLNNSDIVNVNSIYTADLSDGPGESISFKRSNGNYDTLRMADGVILFGADYVANKSINEYKVLHQGNLSISVNTVGQIELIKSGVTDYVFIRSIRAISEDRKTNLNTAFDKGYNRLLFTHSTYQTTTGNPSKDAHILHLGWDTSGGYDSQLAVLNGSDEAGLEVRGQNAGTWGSWYKVALIKTNQIYGNERLILNQNIKNNNTCIGVKNGNYELWLLIGDGNINRGLYDMTNNDWMIYRDSTTNIYMKGSVLATGGITAYSSSDIRLKENLHKLNYLSIIKAMGGSYGFTWRKDNKRSIGWIAQHVLSNPYMKDIVETDKDGYYKINYWSPKLIATAFGAIEQVDDEVTKLKARVVYLEREVKKLTSDK